MNPHDDKPHADAETWARYWTYWYERHTKEAAEAKKLAEEYGAVFTPSHVVQNWRYIPANPPPNDTPIELLCADSSVARVDYYDGYGRFHDGRVSNVGGIFWRPVSVPSTIERSDACRAALANIMARIDGDEFIPTEYKEDARAALAGPSTSDDVIHAIVDWRGLIASKDGGSRVTLGDAIGVGDHLVSALIEETGRRKRAEILLQAMNGHYVRSAIAPKPEVLKLADETISKAMSWIGGFICSGPGQEERRADMIEECRGTLAEIRRTDGRKQT